VTTVSPIVPSVNPADWTTDLIPESDSAVELFNGHDLSGWDGHVANWSVDQGSIRAANDCELLTSTYLFTKKAYRNFRLLFEAKQQHGERYKSPMHSAVAILGERIKDQDECFGFKGLLLMFCGDWGIWDAHGRNRIYPPGQPQELMWQHRSEQVGQWNRVEVLVIGNRIRMVNNGKLVVDYTERLAHLKASPIGLQLPQQPHGARILFSWACSHRKSRRSGYHAGHDLAQKFFHAMRLRTSRHRIYLLGILLFSPPGMPALLAAEQIEIPTLQWGDSKRPDGTTRHWNPQPLIDLGGNFGFRCLSPANQR